MKVRLVYREPPGVSKGLFAQVACAYCDLSMAFS